MIYVLLAEHDAQVCPTSNSRMREVMLKGASEIPNVAKKHGVKIIAGPWANWEHVTVAALEADKAESVDRFIAESGLAQWNRVRVLPSRPLIPDGIKEVESSRPLF